MDLTCQDCRHVVEVEEGRSAKCPNCGARVLPPGRLAAVSQEHQPEDPLPPAAPPTSVEHPSETTPKPVTRPASIVALVCGLILCVPVVPQALAICFGVFAIARQRLPDERVGAALAGTILGLLALLGWLAAWTFIPATGIFRPATGLPPGYVTARGYPGSTGAEEDWLRTSAWADTMERVYRSAAAYHRDYREWPADLESLEGAYLPNGFELSPAMTFRPVPSPEPAGGGWIMIVSDPTLYDRQGERLPKSHRLVLRLSGRIELLVAADVDGLLADQNGNAAP